MDYISIVIYMETKEMSEIIDRLIKQSDDIAKSGISGYGNTMLDAIEEIKCITQRNAELEAELARLRDHVDSLACGISRDAWHDTAWSLLHSKTIDDKQIMRVNIHTIRAVFDATYDALNHAQPKPPELPDVDALAEFMHSIDSDDECHSYSEMAKHVCEWLKKGGV